MTEFEIHSEPTTEEEFRRELTRLLVKAKMNDVSVTNRSWECSAEEIDRIWDVEIFLVRTEIDSDIRESTSTREKD